MFTNEMNYENSITTILDETGVHSDVILTVEQDGYVFIEQEDEDGFVTNLITMPPNMFKEFFASLNLPEGAYRYE